MARRHRGAIQELRLSGPSLGDGAIFGRLLPNLPRCVALLYHSLEVHEVHTCAHCSNAAHLPDVHYPTTSSSTSSICPLRMSSYRLIPHCPQAHVAQVPEPCSAALAAAVIPGCAGN